MFFHSADATFFFWAGLVIFRLNFLYCGVGTFFIPLLLIISAVLFVVVRCWRKLWLARIWRQLCKLYVEKFWLLLNVEDMVIFRLQNIMPKKRNNKVNKTPDEVFLDGVGREGREKNFRNRNRTSQVIWKISYLASKLKCSQTQFFLHFSPFSIL